MVQMQIYGILRKETKERKKCSCKLVLIKGSQILVGVEGEKKVNNGRHFITKRWSFSFFSNWVGCLAQSPIFRNCNCKVNPLGCNRNVTFQVIATHECLHCTLHLTSVFSWILSWTNCKFLLGVLPKSCVSALPSLPLQIIYFDTLGVGAGTQGRGHWVVQVLM